MSNVPYCVKAILVYLKNKNVKKCKAETMPIFPHLYQVRFRFLYKNSRAVLLQIAQNKTSEINVTTTVHNGNS
jgi:hypothetical protein